MEYEYDRETDILTIVLRERAPEYGEQTENIITHYAEDGKPVEIEILDASTAVLDMMRPMLRSGTKTAEA